MEKIKDVADKFVRVRLTRIEKSNLRLFEFDYDLTFMVFFLSPDEKVYARYGGRCKKGPNARQSLAGLRYTMKSVVAEHQSNSRRFAPTQDGKEFYVNELAQRSRQRCFHCHQVKEMINRKLKREGTSNLDLAFRYPLPENLGLRLEVDRGNVVGDVVKDSAAAKTGLQKGDVIRTLNQIPIHSFGDAQFALDRAPKKGTIDVTWQRANSVTQAKLELPNRWRRTDITWRPSIYDLVPYARVYGQDLTIEEKAAIGLSAEQLAFRQKSQVAEQARKAGVRAGDIILGFDDKDLKMTAYKFLDYVSSNYVKSEVVTVNAIRDGRRLKLRMKLE